ncbi:MAG: cation-translocating P-type ATPase [Flavobacteriaceae bacterium]|nr:cation-translocating P-type ATPase [Flavobacteriaceae bacterium]
MKINQKNILIIASGFLLIAAFISYLLKLNSLLINILLIAASVIAGFPIVKKALQAIRMKAFSIELLVSIAVIGAIIIGEYVESAAVTFLFLFGAFLEARTLEKTRSSLKSLVKMIPIEATVERDGKLVTIPAEEVKKGDHVFIQSGEKVAIDGRVFSGTALINEATITGESVPVKKEKDTKVYSSTILDNGYLEVVAEKVGNDTTFAKIIDMVEEAQESKAKTQKFLERFANFYTPGILVLSAVVLLFTWDIHITLTFLVIACPGALVISAPVSIVAGIGNGAKHGILIKGGDKMEKLAKVDGIVFDKTGTLTQGKPTVTAINTYGIEEDELLLMAAEVEVASEHHLGRTIVKEAEIRVLKLVHKPNNVQIIKGQGIKATVNKKELLTGNKKVLINNHIPFTEAMENDALEQEIKGNTAVYVSDNKRLLGIISIADKIREEAAEVIYKLKQSGIRNLVMLTGDNEHTANKVAKQLGIEKIFANLLPEDKVEHVKACKQKGKILAMIGDGINDAPAIATANVGIAMGGAGTDIAMETADVILLSDDLNKLVYAFKLSKATVRNMKQNMFFAVGIVFLLLTGVLTGKVFFASGMLIHELSVLIVILNAIRLVHFPKYQFELNP